MVLAPGGVWRTSREYKIFKRHGHFYSTAGNVQSYNEFNEFRHCIRLPKPRVNAAVSWWLHAWHFHRYALSKTSFELQGLECAIVILESPGKDRQSKIVCLRNPGEAAAEANGGPTVNSQEAATEKFSLFHFAKSQRGKAAKPNHVTPKTQQKRPWFLNSEVKSECVSTSFVKIHKICEEFGETKTEASPACNTFCGVLRCGCLGGMGGPQFEQIFANFTTYIPTLSYLMCRVLACSIPQNNSGLVYELVS